MIITTERLHYLWAVAETGSFAAAGRRLGVSGAAVQQVIRHFEQDLDAPLFRRSPGRSPVLTDLLRHRQLLPLPGVISSDAFYDSFRLSSHLVHYSQFYQLQEMLLAGMGFAVFPAQLARPFVEQGRLKLLELDFDDGISTTAVELAWVEPLGTAGRWLVERLRELPTEEGGR